MRCPWSLLLSWLNTPSPPSLSPQQRGPAFRPSLWPPLDSHQQLPILLPLVPELEAAPPGQSRGESLPWTQTRLIFQADTTHGQLTSNVSATGIPSLGRGSIPSLHWYQWLSHSRFCGSLMKAKYDLKQLNILHSSWI